MLIYNRNMSRENWPIIVNLSYIDHTDHLYVTIDIYIGEATWRYPSKLELHLEGYRRIHRTVITFKDKARGSVCEAVRFVCICI